jgi:hypothetical protein
VILCGAVVLLLFCGAGRSARPFGGLRCGQYVINDMYIPYIAPGKSDQHYVTASRLAMFGLTVAAVIAATFLTSILGSPRRCSYLPPSVSGEGAFITRFCVWRITDEIH